MLVPVPARRFIYSCLALPLLASVGCGSDLADDPLFNDQQATVQRIDDDLDGLRSQVEQLNRGMNDLLTEVENLKGEPLTGNVPGQRLEQRVEVLEAAIRESNQALSKIRNDMSEVRNEMSNMEEAVASAAARPSSRNRTGDAEPSSGSSSSRVTLERTPSPSRPEPEPTPTPKPQGFYHTVKSGETVASLAERFGVSEASIRKANHIPEGRNPLPGQNIYIVP